MKKLVLTIAIVLGLSMTTFANPDGGGLFQRGAEIPTEGVFRSSDTPMLPIHNQNENQDANAPLGSGLAVLLGLGAAYAVAKKRQEK